MIKKLILTIFALSSYSSLYPMKAGLALEGETIIEYNNLSLSEHIKLIELSNNFSGADETFYSCNICKESFKNMPDLISHGTIHKKRIPTNISPFRGSSIKKFKTLDQNLDQN